MARTAETSRKRPAQALSADLLQRIGAIVKTRREESGLTQGALGKRCKCKQSQISEVENGKSPSLSVNLLMAICHGLHLRLGDVVQQAEGGTFVAPGLFPFSRQADSYESRLELWAFEKHCIAEAIAHVLRTELAGQLVGIDGGTSNQFLADAIGRDVAQGQRTVGMIVTNHIGIPERVATGRNAPNVRLMSGVFRPDRKTLIDPGATESLSALELAACVVGANAFRYPTLFTMAGLEDAVKQKFMDISNTVMIPLDPSKWGKVTGNKVAAIDDLLKRKKTVLLFGICPSSEALRNHNLTDEEIKKLRSLFKESAEQLLKWQIRRVTVKESESINAMPKLTEEDATGHSIDQLMKPAAHGRSREVLIFRSK